MLKVREYLSAIKLRVIKYLTPINYIEYSFKMCFVLKVKSLRLLSYMLLIFNMIMLLVSVLYTKIINPVSIIISMLITHITLTLFIGWRKRIKGIKSKEELPEMKLTPLILKKYDVPIMLNRFKNKNNKGE